MQNSKTGVITFIAFVAVVIMQMLAIVTGGYYYATQHAINGEVSFALKKGKMYINESLYSLSGYDLPYNYVIFPAIGLGMILFIVEAITVSSFLFSLSHFHYGIGIILTLFAFSIFLGMAMKITNSIYSSILLHVINNFIPVTYL